jgi:hypothetical protein
MWSDALNENYDMFQAEFIDRIAERGKSAITKWHL